MSIDLTPRLRDAGKYMKEHGWTQGKMQAPNGAVCLHGAVRFCDQRNGDNEIVSAVLRRKGFSENWNDDGVRGEPDVLEVLRTVEVTDADLLDTFGPQWEAIVALVRRSASLSAGEVKQLAAAWDAAGAAARAAARGAAGAAAWAAAGAAARDAARDAARALAARDLIGQHGFTQEHYDLLTKRWADVIGKVHPDD